MKDMVGTLMKIRGLREKRKAREEREKRDAVLQSEQAEADAQSAIEEFSRTRQEKTQAIYDGLIGRNLRLRDVDWFRFELENLKREDQRLRDARETCRQAVRQAEEVHREAESAHQEASRQLSKFEALAEEQKKSARLAAILENDAKEEDALEALINRPGGR